MKKIMLELPNCLRIWPLEQTEEWFWIENEGSYPLCKHLLAGNMKRSDRDHGADPETPTRAGSFLCSDMVSNVDHEALDDPSPTANLQRSPECPSPFHGAQPLYLEISAFFFYI